MNKLYDDSVGKSRSFADPAIPAGEAMAEKGFNVIPIIDGSWHRFSVNGDRNFNGFYKFFCDNIPAGVFGNWATGESYKWCSKSDSEMTPIEKAVFRSQMEAAKAERKQIQVERWDKAAIEACEIWETAADVVDHPYLKKKQVPAIGLKGSDGRLIIPVYNENEQLQSLQFISSDGSKRFHPGGKMAGGWNFLEGDPDRVAIVEGYATGVTINQVTGATVYIAFNAGNLKAVAQIVKARHPGAQIVVCCDNDQWTEGNPGLTKGREAADAIGADVAVPIFKKTSGKPTDFNDLAALEGPAEVKRQITRENPGKKKENIPVPVTAAALRGMAFKMPEWIIPGILLPGLYIFAAKPKMGKSMMALNLGVSIATGGMALGSIPIRCSGDVIYFSMEDNLRRLKQRLDKMCSGSWPENLLIYDTWAGVPFVESIITDKTRLIIIDTLQRTRDDRNAGKQDLYQYDYKSISPLQTIASQKNIAILIIHHLRKSDDDDPHSCISGSLGLTGAADGTWVLKRKTGAADAVLYTQGRDFEGQELALKFHAETFMWELLGDAADIQSTGDRQAVYDAIRQALEPIKANDLVKMTGIKSGTVSRILFDYLRSGQIEKVKYGFYKIKPS